jgi:hypothetical protein
LYIGSEVLDDLCASAFVLIRDSLAYRRAVLQAVDGCSALLFVPFGDKEESFQVRFKNAGKKELTAAAKPLTHCR